MSNTPTAERMEEVAAAWVKDEIARRSPQASVTYRVIKKIAKRAFLKGYAQGWLDANQESASRE